MWLIHGTTLQRAKGIIENGSVCVSKNLEIKTSCRVIFSNTPAEQWVELSHSNQDCKKICALTAQQSLDFRNKLREFYSMNADNAASGSVAN